MTGYHYIEMDQSGSHRRAWGGNLYGFVGNEPIGWFDLWGLSGGFSNAELLAEEGCGIENSFTDPATGETLTGAELAVEVGMTVPKEGAICVLSGPVLRLVGKITAKLGGLFCRCRPAAKGLTTPAKYFGNLTAEEVADAMTKKLGPPRSIRAGAETYYNPATRRSYNLHTDPAHGPPHVDIRRRDGFPERKFPIAEEGQ